MKVYAGAVKRRDRLSGAYPEAYDAALGWARRDEPKEEETPTDGGIKAPMGTGRPGRA